MGVAVGLLLVFALALVAAPIALNAVGHGLGAMSSSIMIGSGIALAVVCAILLVVTKLYVKTKASEAFVRTGMGGLKVIQDGGAIVLPVVHQVVKVTLETIRLEVMRQGADALITADKLRADIKAEFFVRVQPQEDSIKAAARSLGEKMAGDDYRRQEGSKSAVATLIEDKLVSSLRTSAARKTLEQLNSERDEFLKEVVGMVAADLTHNGFTLETVTISKLDQTDEALLKDNNIFDAQGKRTIAEITQKNLTQKNEIVRRGERERTAQDVDTRKQVLELERSRVEAEATQASQVASIQADQDRQSKEKQIEAARAIEVAQVQQQQQIEVAKRTQQQVIEIAERDKLRAVTEADQKVEVAKRTSQEAVAKSEAQKVQAEAKLADAEADRARARQGIVTVETVATAEREKQKAVIAAAAEAEKGFVAQQRRADGDAYATNAQADARKKSADADAEAVRKKAEAEAEAQKLSAAGRLAVAVAEADGQKAKALAEAEGQKAVAMVPVDVQAKQVQVDQSRVENVLKPELEARAQYGDVAQKFEIAKIRIEAEKEVRIETAKAMVGIYGKITANVYGTPEDVAKMGNAFSSGMGLANAIGGFVAGADPEVLRAVGKAVETVTDLGQAAADRLKPSAEK